MPSSALDYLHTLESALLTLNQQTSASSELSNTSKIITAARAVSLAADDAEFAAAETANADFRKKLNEKVSIARTAAVDARFLARNAALNTKRQELLSSSQSPKDENEDDNMTEAARIAAQINDGLRRATAIVTEEIDRSTATANVLDHSSKRLRATKDQHKTYGSALQSGSKTLSELKRSERMANIGIVLSVILFFFAATYVIKKRVTDGNIANFVVKPAYRTFKIPFRIVTTVFGIKDPSKLVSTEVNSAKVETDKNVWYNLETKEDTVNRNKKIEPTNTKADSTNEKHATKPTEVISDVTEGDTDGEDNEGNKGDDILTEDNANGEEQARKYATEKTVDDSIMSDISDESDQENIQSHSQMVHDKDQIDRTKKIESEQERSEDEL